MIEIISLKPEDKERLNSHALERLNDWHGEVLSKVPQLRELSADQLKNDLGAHLAEHEIAELNECLATIRGWIYECMDTGGRYFPRAYDTHVIASMSRIKSLIIETYQKAEEERRQKEYDDRRRAAFLAMTPPLDDAKKHLDAIEYHRFLLAIWDAIDVYLEKGASYLIDLRTFDLRWWLDKIQERRAKEVQKQRAAIRANEYSQRLNQETVELMSHLDDEQPDLKSYFRSRIRDKRHTNHSFDYVLFRKNETDFDGTLVGAANKKLQQLCPEGLRQFIVLPSQYYRRYYPLPSASYSLEEVPSLKFRLDVFGVAYSEVWLRPAKIILDGYEFLLPRVKDGNGLPLMEKPKLLGYYCVILGPEDLGSHLFWKRIPLVLLKELISGEEKPDGSTILAATDSTTTYRVQGLQKEVEVPDRFIS